MRRRAWIVLLALLLIPVVPGLADARGRHGGGHGYKGGHGHRGGHGHGHRGGHGYSYRGGYGYQAWYGPWWYPTYYAYPYPYPYLHETTVIVEETPIYVERPQEAAPRPAPPEPAYWYYCESRGGYYPDVAKCPEDWVKVLPRPD